MTFNTITSKSPIGALRYNDYVGVDDTSNAGQTLKATPEQVREYATVGFGSTLPIFNRKMAGVKTGQNNCRVAIVGDSVTVGLGAFSSGDRLAWGYTSIAQRMFGKVGVSAQRDWLTSNGDGTSSQYDGRIILGSSWTGNGGNSLGGAMYNAATNTNALSFTPTGIVDTFVIYFPTSGSLGLGTFAADIDGGTPTTQSEGGANSISKVTITASAPGIHTCNIKYSSGGTVYIAEIEAYNSKVSQLQIMACGWGGATTGNVTTTVNAWDPLLALKYVAPDLTIIATGINDWHNGVSLSTFQTNYQSLITAALVSGDCVALLPPPTLAATTPQATQDGYIAIIRTLAATNNIPVIDIYDRYQTHTFSSLLYFDDFHPNVLGYEVMGKGMFDMLSSTGPGSFQPTSSIPLLIQTVANNTYTYIGYAGLAGTVLGVYEKARALTTAGTFAITINGTNITGLSAVVPTIAGSYNYATALNTFNRGAKIQIVYTSTSLVLDHTLTLDIATAGVPL